MSMTLTKVQVTMTVFYIDPEDGQTYTDLHQFVDILPHCPRYTSMLGFYQNFEIQQIELKREEIKDPLPVPTHVFDSEFFFH